MGVRRTLGPAFPDQFYREALATELLRRAIPFERDVAYAVYYKGQALRGCGRFAFLCFDEVLVEVRAAASLCDPDVDHVRHCVVASPYHVGLLLNFGWYRLEHRHVRRPDDSALLGEGLP